MLSKLKHGALAILSQLSPSPWTSRDRVRVAVQIDTGFDSRLWIDALARELPDWSEKVELQFAPDRMALYAAARDAQVISAMNLSTGLLGVARRAKWINVLLSGVNLDALSRVGVGVKVTSSRGIAARSMAEYALLYFLSLRSNLRVALRNQDEWRWSEEGLLRCSDDLRSQTVAVFGLGAAGNEVVKIFRAIGLKTIGVRRSTDEPHSYCDELCALNDFHLILPRVDLVVLTLPVTERTRNLFSDSEFRSMKPSSILVNLSRGALLREDHLAVALRTGMIGGAGLDVLSDEPPSPDHPLRGCPNLIITPHVSGNIQRFRTQIAARFARNLSAFLKELPLEGLV